MMSLKGQIFSLIFIINCISKSSLIIIFFYFIIYFLYREALTDMFEHCDLDDNGYLSREEFDLFQMKSGGDQCDDDAWEVMKGNLNLQ